ncbi:MAG: hypothetical protein KDB00_14145 [Planctomycetales bacterium]|nr:hypothetical protein [Planctomycetales bacterium]
MSPVLQSSNETLLVTTVASLVVWVLIRVAMGLMSKSNRRWLLAPISLLVACAFWRSALSVIDSLCETAGTWPPGVLAIVAAVTCEAVLIFYVDHRGSRPGIVHWLPIGLRLLLVLILAFILMEPIVSHQEEELSQRHVAVLMDGSASMDLSDLGTATDHAGEKLNRRAVSRQLMLGNRSGGKSLLDELESDYNVRLFEFAATPRELKTADWRNERPVGGQNQIDNSSSASGDWAKTTDTAAAIRRVEDQVPLDELSGLIVVTDGCDHSGNDLQESVRNFVHRKIPIHTVVVGDQTPISDTEVTTVQTPQHVFHGDSVAIRAPIKVDGLEGQSVKVRLVKDDQPIDEKTIKVGGNRHRETVVFRDQPDEVGVHQYTVEVDPLPGERNTENNRLTSRVWVSKDYIRMLIVENRPRWEFRYLRNLFAGRDRSVHLQYVLLRPDRLAAVPDPPIMHASVNRTFDDCEATALPENEEEWLKFDVIVLGDVAPDDLGTDVMRTLEKFVASRAGTLVVVSGRHHMPHAYERTPLADALPVQLAGARPGDATSPDSQYYFKIASGAESHVIMQQSTDPRENDAVWQSLPQLHWRHPASKAKAGATVLAYAGRTREGAGSQEDQRDHALILWHRFGAGKVMQLAFDQTWRLRYGIGDQHHHRFWGQLLRWSIQDRLAAGTELVRMGTDRALYRVGDTVIVRARLLDNDRNLVKSEDSKVLVYLGDELVQQSTLTSQSESAGMLAAKIDGLNRVGKYRIELTGRTVDRLLQTEGRSDESVSVDIALEGPEAVTEISDLVANATVPSQLADWTGGIVTGPSEASSILERLGPKTTFHRDQWTVPVWNRWPVIIAFLMIAGVEWGLRKSTGLI